MEAKETKGMRIRPRSMIPSQEYRDGWDRVFNGSCSSVGRASDCESDDQGSTPAATPINNE